MTWDYAFIFQEDFDHSNNYKEEFKFSENFYKISEIQYDFGIDIKKMTDPKKKFASTGIRAGTLCLKGHHFTAEPQWLDGGREAERNPFLNLSGRALVIDFQI